MPKLTKTVVDNAEPREKQFSIWCSDLKGFGVLVNPTGKRTYVVDYRTADGVRRRMAIGQHGQITTEQARKLALETIGGIVIQKADPLDARRTRRASLTVAELCEDYFTAADKGLVLGRAGRPKKASTLALDRSMVEAHINPLIGRRLVIDLKKSDVQKFVGSIVAGKTAKAEPEKSGRLRGRVRRQGGPGAASRCTQTLGAILSWAVSQGILETSPAAGVKKPSGGKRTRRLTAPEFQAFAKALADAAEVPGQNWQPLAELRLLALTGCRLGEIEKLRWSEVDLASSVLQLADTKTGPSIRPLGRAARDLIETFPKTNGEFVFPAKRLDDRPFAGMKRAYRKLFAAAGLDGITPHVLRHSFASVAADLGFTDSTIGAMLGHAGSGITSRYTHRLDSVLIAAADKVAGEIAMYMSEEKAGT